MTISVQRPKLHAGQKTVLASPARFKTLACGRRWGKSLLATYWLAMREGSAMFGKPVGYFAPEYKRMEEVWDVMSKTLHQVIKAKNKNTGRMTLTTGGVIDFWTLEDERAGASRKYARVVIDEAAHARNLKDVWEQAIGPTLIDLRGEAWFISTPNGINFFHDLFLRGEDPDFPEWASFHMPSTVNPFIPASEVYAKRSELPELVFRQEYLAEFVTFGAGLVKPEMLVNAQFPVGLPVVLGVDLAISEKQGADYTAICAMGRDPATGIVYIKEVERHRCAFNDVLNCIKAAAARHSPRAILIEQTQYQAAVVQELCRTTTLPVQGIRPDRDKLTRFMPLLTRYEQLMVRHDPSGVPAWFRNELLSFPEGANDDGVDAAAYSFLGIDRSVSIASAIPAPAKKWGVM